MLFIRVWRAAWNSIIKMFAMQIERIFNEILVIFALALVRSTGFIFRCSCQRWPFIGIVSPAFTAHSHMVAFQTYSFSDSFALQTAIIQIDYCWLTTMAPINETHNHFLRHFIAKIIEKISFIYIESCSMISHSLWTFVTRQNEKKWRFVVRCNEKNKPEMNNYLICIIQIDCLKLTLSIECFVI